MRSYIISQVVNSIFLLTISYNEVYNEYAKTQPLTGSIEDNALRQLTGSIHYKRPRSNTRSFTLRKIKPPQCYQH